jgi:hypothetical protein
MYLCGVYIELLLIALWEIQANIEMNTSWERFSAAKFDLAAESRSHI